MKGYRKLRKHVLDILDSKISHEFCYHGMNHTLDVLEVCNQYIKRERISGHKAKLLRIAALMHDIGFTASISEHEYQSAKIAETLMAEYCFPKVDIDVVKGLIMATRIPQRPKNRLEKILCDADLDYLGREDYYPTSKLLFKELTAHSKPMTSEEWNKAQIEFLEAHRYHTEFARKHRQPQKDLRIEELKHLENRPD